MRQCVLTQVNNEFFNVDGHPYLTNSQAGTHAALRSALCQNGDGDFAEFPLERVDDDQAERSMLNGGQLSHPTIGESTLGSRV